MSNFINELTVMQFYIERIDSDSITFLKGRESYKTRLRSLVSGLMAAETMNEKINIAISLWKSLFEASMSYISPDKRGYDNIFKFFDSYVEFEELIFASDSFYRDHTLHCIWVYFLGEYIANKPQFSKIFIDKNYNPIMIETFHEVFPTDLNYKMFSKKYSSYLEKEEAIRCVAALTHDLGYPLKKVEKINKSIKKVLPYFAVNNFNDFKFEFTNTQQGFTETFIDFISRTLNINITNKEECDLTEENLKKANTLVQSIFKLDSSGNVVGIDKDQIKNISEEDLRFLHDFWKIKDSFSVDMSNKISFLNDFENYQHGIMSAFLLMKNLPVFQTIQYNTKKDRLNFSDTAAVSADVILALSTILVSISSHTCDNYQIKDIDEVSYLTIIDELEEFSRISRASQNREYVKEFCESSIDFTEDGWLDIKFIFNNSHLENLDPERAFKGRCKRFISLFDIKNLSQNLKVRVTIKGELPNNNNEYVLEIANKYVDIRINGLSQNIPEYLKSTQFYTKEEYASL